MLRLPLIGLVAGTRIDGLGLGPHGRLSMWAFGRLAAPGWACPIGLVGLESQHGEPGLPCLWAWPAGTGLVGYTRRKVVVLEGTTAF